MPQEQTSKHCEELDAAEEMMLDWLGEKILAVVGFVPALAVAVGLMLAVESVPAARAQVTLDVAKIKCEQYTSHKITNPQNIAIWLSGYYHGKRGDTTLETQALIANAKKVRDYCFRNPQTLLMDAVEKLFGGESR
jgi:acid stress chaperone HdeB